MAEKQGVPEDTPPPAYPGVNASPANALHPPQPHNAGTMPPPQNPGYPTTKQQQWQGGPGYPSTAHPHAIAPPYPGPQSNTQDPKSGQPGYPAQPDYPVAQRAPTTMTHQQVTVVGGGGAVHYQAQVIPQDNAGLAWFSCLFCFCPLGMIAIVRSNQARRAINEGNYPLAAQLGMQAGRYAKGAIYMGFLLTVVFVLIRAAAR